MECLRYVLDADTFPSRSVISQNIYTYIICVCVCTCVECVVCLHAFIGICTCIVTNLHISMYIKLVKICKNCLAEMKYGKLVPPCHTRLPDPISYLCVTFSF